MGAISLPERRLVVDATTLSHSCSLLAKHLCSLKKRGGKICKIYGIPKSGCIVAAHLAAIAPKVLQVVYEPEKADYFVDDIIDTGKTQKLYLERYGKDTYALYGKGKHKNCIVQVPATQWVEF